MSEERRQRAELEERLLRLLPIGAAALVVVLAFAIGGIFGPSFGVLVLAVGAMLAAIAALWTSLRALFGETPLSREDAFAIGAPSAEEEQKRAVLRAIKDLEFEHGVGKISTEDYEELIARYRAEAKRLLREIDQQASPERLRVERIVARHLRDRGIEPAWLAREEAEAPAPPSDAPKAVEEDDEDDGPPSGEVVRREARS